MEVSIFEDPCHFHHCPLLVMKFIFVTQSTSVMYLLIAKTLCKSKSLMLFQKFASFHTVKLTMSLMINVMFVVRW